MIANRRQLLALRRHFRASLALDDVRRAAVLREAARDDDAVAVDVVFISFVALVLERDRHFRRAERIEGVISKRDRVRGGEGVRTLGPRG